MSSVNNIYGVAISVVKPRAGRRASNARGEKDFTAEIDIVDCFEPSLFYFVLLFSMSSVISLPERFVNLLDVLNG